MIKYECKTIENCAFLRLFLPQGFETLCIKYVVGARTVLAFAFPRNQLAMSRAVALSSTFQGASEKVGDLNTLCFCCKVLLVVKDPNFLKMLNI